MLEGNIGVFDSGCGGITVWREIIKLLPEYSTVYVGDSKNCPYGAKSRDEIIILSEKISKFLIENNCPLITVACNTITAAAIDYLRKNYPNIIFVGMEPATKIAAQNTKTKSIGILATQNTFKGELFNLTKQKFASDINVEIQVGNGLVELVESNKIDTQEAIELLKKYINPLLEKKVDQLVLGCTHYPFLINQIKKITGEKVNIIEPSLAVARQVQKKLLEKNIQPTAVIPQHHFYTSAAKAILQEFLKPYSKLNIKISEQSFGKK